MATFNSLGDYYNRLANQSLFDAYRQQHYANAQRQNYQNLFGMGSINSGSTLAPKPDKAGEPKSFREELQAEINAWLK